MSDHQSVKMLYVFLASPGDLQPEREAARQVVQSVNRSVAPAIGWRVELLGWEDTLPGPQRPQERINDAVDRCHLFVGLVWQRWGQPTGAGTFTSGFEEEFDRANRRRAETRAPDIWLFFKEVASDRLTDPGEQLKSVLAFKEAQVSLKQHLFKIFSDTHDWERKFGEYLSTHLLSKSKELAVEQDIVGTHASSRPTRQQTDSLTTTLVRPDPTPDHWISDLLYQTAKHVQDGALEDPRLAVSLINQDDVSRLQLVSVSLSSIIFDREEIGIHEINNLYHRRNDVTLSMLEKKAVMETLLTDDSEIRPGWYWYRQVDPERLSGLLFAIAATHDDPRVRDGALATIEMAPELPNPEAVDRHLVAVIEHGSTPISERGLKLLISRRLDAAWDILDNIEGDPDQNQRNLRAVIVATSELKKDPTTAFQHLLEASDEQPHPLVQATLEAHKALLDDRVLVTATTHRLPWFREFGARVLAGRGKMTNDTAYALLEDSSIEVRELAYRHLILAGIHFGEEKIRTAFDQAGLGRGLLSGFGGFAPRAVDPEDLLLLQYMETDEESLRKKIDWYSVDGPLAYKALALRYFDSAKEDIRLDLRNDFANIHEQSISRYALEYGPESLDKLQEVLDKHKRFIMDRFRASALAGMAKNGEACDIEFGRKYMSDDNDFIVRKEALAVVGRFGGEKDVTSVLKLADDAYGVIKKQALRIAIRLDPSEIGTAKIILRRDDIDSVRAVLECLGEQASREMSKIIVGLLYHDNETIRKMGISKLSSMGAVGEDLLTGYEGAESYYYNVVFWLDRLIFPCAPLRAAFKREIESVLDLGGE